MPWTNATLTSPSVSVAAIETATLNLFIEWLEQFFTNETHNIGTQALTCPTAKITTQDGVMDQPLAGVANITLVWATVGKMLRRRDNAGGAFTGFQQATFIVHIRCKGTVGGKDAKIVCREVGELLYGILQLPTATRQLGQKGVTHVRATNPVIKSSPLYAQRDIQITAELQFPVAES